LEYLTTHTSISPIGNTAWGFVNYKKGYTQLIATSDKVYQFTVTCPWSVVPASSATKTGRHDIAEILLKVALNTKKSINH
jgi:hypothetical protein